MQLVEQAVLPPYVCICRSSGRNVVDTEKVVHGVRIYLCERCATLAAGFFTVEPEDTGDEPAETVERLETLEAFLVELREGLNAMLIPVVEVHEP
jgi:hypothetical protein